MPGSVLSMFHIGLHETSQARGQHVPLLQLRKLVWETLLCFSVLTHLARGRSRTHTLMVWPKGQGP